MKLSELVKGQFFLSGTTGPMSEASGRYPEPTPYKNFFDIGIFESRKDEVWKYYKFPIDVRTDFLPRAEDIIENQAFLVDTFSRLSRALDIQVDKTRADHRRRFHISLTASEFQGIKPPEGSSEETKDYLRRMSDKYTMPVWHGYMGVELLRRRSMYGTHSITEKIKRYVDFLKDPDSTEWLLYEEDLEEVDSIMFEEGFSELDFIENPEDLEQITCWHGIKDERYEVDRRLDTTSFLEPRHGLSVVVPKWGEIMFHAAQPAKGRSVRDPLAESNQWARPVYTPGSHVVAVSLRGEIRSANIMSNMLETKLKSAQGERDQRKIEKIIEARSLTEEGKIPGLDNLEILIASQVPEPGKSYRIQDTFKQYGMELKTLVDRQPLALLSTLPGYPEYISKIPRGNAKRPGMSNVALPGFLAMSGLMRSMRPCADDGVLLGLSLAGNEYRPIFTGWGAAGGQAVPNMLVSGRPGSGKTMEMLQCVAQAKYADKPAVFLNYKSEGTLRAFFESLDGFVMSMSRDYLRKNPGIMDPLLFIKDRERAAALLASHIISAARLGQDKGSASSSRRTKITAEIMERSKMNGNRSSFDIVFGNAKAGTPALTDIDLLETMSNKAKTDPVWIAILGRSKNMKALAEEVQRSTIFLMEWDESFELPTSGTNRADYTDGHVSSITSMNLGFIYALEKLRNTGGLLAADESWVLKYSEESLSQIKKASRELREADILMMLGTQRIADWLSGEDNLSTYFGRYLFMAITDGDEEDLDLYFKITRLPRTRKNVKYITEAGISKVGAGQIRSIPVAYYVDRIYNWDGGILCGPWPDQELNAGRSDTAAKEARHEFDDDEDTDEGFFGGALADVIQESRELEE